MQENYERHINKIRYKYSGWLLQLPRGAVCFHRCVFPSMAFLSNDWYKLTNSSLSRHSNPTWTLSYFQITCEPGEHFPWNHPPDSNESLSRIRLRSKTQVSHIANHPSHALFFHFSAHLLFYSALALFGLDVCLSCLVFFFICLVSAESILGSEKHVRRSKNEPHSTDTCEAQQKWWMQQTNKIPFFWLCEVEAQPSRATNVALEPSLVSVQKKKLTRVIFEKHKTGNCRSV